MHPPLFASGILRALPFAALALGACGASPAAMPSATPPSLVGHAWAWQGARNPTGERIVVSAPDRYTIEFMADGVVRVRADCNRGSGRFSTGPGARLTLGPIATTKMGCPDGSQDRLFLKMLGSVARYRFEGTHLVLAASGEEATMRLDALEK